MGKTGLAIVVAACALTAVGCAGAASPAPDSAAGSTGAAATRPRPSVDPAPTAAPLPPVQPRFTARRGFNEAEALTLSGTTLWVARWQNPGGGSGLLLVPLRAATLALAGPPVPVRTPSLNAALATAAGGAVYLRTGGRTGRIEGGHVVWVSPGSVPAAVAERLLGTPGFGRAWMRAGLHLLSIEPATGQRRSFQLPATVGGAAAVATAAAPAVAAGLIWVVQPTDANRAYLEAVTPGGGRVGPALAVGRGIPVLVLAVAGRLWVADNSQTARSTLWQVDPATHRVIAHTTLPVGFLPMFGAGSGAAMWLGEEFPDGGVRRVELLHR